MKYEVKREAVGEANFKHVADAARAQKLSAKLRRHQVRVDIIGHARIRYVGNYQSCMV